jgi:hypothetical protein
MKQCIIKLFNFNKKAETALSRFTYLRNWALLEKLPIVQPLKNFPAFYSIHKSPPFVPILRQIDPVHTIPSYL